MNLMSEHLNKVAGSKSELILYKLTDKPVKAVSIGALITALIQSSSAVCAMTVSLVENKLLKLKNAIAVILGTIFGTSITGWIIAYSSLDFSNSFLKIFSASTIAAVFAVIGIIFKLFINNIKIKRIGEILLGFSILMLGIKTITDSVEPLKNSEFFIRNISAIKNPILLLLLGAALSGLLQSASASVGLVQTISATGVLTLNSTVSLLLGIGIGASIPVILTAVGKNSDSKRAALSYLLIDSLGALIIGLLYFLIIRIIPIKISIEINPFSITIINTVYRLLLVIIFVPFINRLTNICKKLIKEKSAEALKIKKENKYRINYKNN